MIFIIKIRFYEFYDNIFLILELYALNRIHYCLRQSPKLSISGDPWPLGHVNESRKGGGGKKND